jgi:hypothetical protein
MRRIGQSMAGRGYVSGSVRNEVPSGESRGFGRDEEKKDRLSKQESVYMKLVSDNWISYPQKDY